MSLIFEYLKVSLITHTYNVTTEENITELEEEITYDVTELRMDPDYIRSGRSNAREFTHHITKIRENEAAVAD